MFFFVVQKIHLNIYVKKKEKEITKNVFFIFVKQFSKFDGEKYLKSS